MSRYEFLLPDLGEGLTEAEVRAWLVKVGDAVAEDQPVVEVETAKAAVEIAAPVAGTVTELGAEDGALIPVGALLIALDVSAPIAPSSGEPVRPAPAAVTARRVDAQPDPVAATSGNAPPGPGRRPLAAPSTRAYAVAAGVDLHDVTGTGPAGRITQEDVIRAVSAANNHARPVVPSGPSMDEVVPLRGTRRQIALTMTRSWQTIPHVTEFREVDATALVSARSALQAQLGDLRLTYLPFFILACARALAKHRALNASLDMDAAEITYRGATHIGVASASDRGLVVPVLHDADRLSLRGAAIAIRDLADRVRSGTIRPADVEGGTFTVSNFGSYGTWLGTPIINPPQSGIAGFGRIRDQVVAVEHRPVVRATLPIAVSADHRVVDGDVLGAFVDELAALLANPILLFAGVG